MRLFNIQIQIPLRFKEQLKLCSKTAIDNNFIKQDKDQLGGQDIS